MLLWHVNRSQSWIHRHSSFIVTLILLRVSIVCAFVSQSADPRLVIRRSYDLARDSCRCYNQRISKLCETQEGTPLSNQLSDRRLPREISVLDRELDYFSFTYTGMKIQEGGPFQRVAS